MKPETKVAFTPGPWRVQANEEQGRYGRRVTVHSSSGMLADCDWNGPEENEANARLIAASPTLYAACRNVIHLLDGSQPKDIPGAIMALQYAIALADGEGGRE